MSDGTAATTPAPTDAVLGGTAPPPPNGAAGAQVPVVPPPAVAAPADPPNEGKPGQPVSGQAAADAKAAADKAELEKTEAAKKAAADTQAAKDAANAAKQAEDKAWTDYKFKAPEGRQLDEAQIKEFVPLARELGLKPEQAQRLVDFQAKGLKAQEAAAHQYAEQARGKELASLKADPVLGGEKWDASLRVANKAIDKFGTPELKAYLHNTRQDANPLLFKIFHSIGVAMADDKLADGAGLGGPAKGTGVNAAKLYPNTKFKNP